MRLRHMPRGVQISLQAIAFRVAGINRPGIAMGDRRDVGDALGAHLGIDAAQLVQSLHIKRQLKHHAWAAGRVFAIDQHHLVVGVGGRTHEHDVAVSQPGHLATVGDHQVKNIGIKRLHAGHVVHIQANVFELRSGVHKGFQSIFMPTDLASAAYLAWSLRMRPENSEADMGKGAQPMRPKLAWTVADLATSPITLL